MSGDKRERIFKLHKNNNKSYVAPIEQNSTHPGCEKETFNRKCHRGELSRNTKTPVNDQRENSKTNHIVQGKLKH